MDLTILTSFVTLMLAISLAAERIVEMLKGWFPNWPIFTPSADLAKEAKRCAKIHCLAGSWGFVIAAVGHVDIFEKLNTSWTHSNDWKSWGYWLLSWLTAGILASGGSAFWNHTLDLLKAAKVQKEQVAISTMNAGATKGLS